jgi:hypothetical protein
MGALEYTASKGTFDYGQVDFDTDAFGKELLRKVEQMKTSGSAPITENMLQEFRDRLKTEEERKKAQEEKNKEDARNASTS